MFIKAWAHLCRTAQEPPCLLPAELEPFLDRTVINDPNGLDLMYLNAWKFMSEAVGSPERSLKLLPYAYSPESLNTMASATFELNPQDLEKLKRRVLSLWDKVHEEEEEEEPETSPTKPANLSTFVVASALAFTCAAKAITTGNDDKNSIDISFGFSADCRSRLKPQVNPNYIGNCVFPCMIDTVVAEDIVDKEDEGILVIVAKKIHSEIRRFVEKGSVLDEAEALIGKWKSMANAGRRTIGIGGSTRFGVYKTDFGWGKPVKVEIVTVHINGVITMAETRDRNGGVEFGLLLYRHELDLFASSFRDGIKGFHY